MVAVPVAPWLSLAVSGSVCVPTESDVGENEVPVPSCPSRLLVHTSELPVSVPSSGSVAFPAKPTDVPCANVALSAGVVMCATGGWLNGGGAFASPETGDSENVLEAPGAIEIPVACVAPQK